MLNLIPQPQIDIITDSRNYIFTVNSPCRPDDTGRGGG